ncbi:DUF6334 family protein [Biformimicrobium ophioploci]|uniref:Uncharacterized protein n=1 Tax=Biformimicrobium ophioploci TaxID=3036711 RepID=A0ABQ6M329_9GAMM|nr:DUF6334 family protein [Microbulbifer sp. NKW57]GMG88754.1 hypothetical protein MNKW57_30750 [Microbulbifer sp. NKW57]
MDSYTICNELGRLEDVIGHFLEDDGITEMLISLEFVFEHGRVFQEAIPEFDEISIKALPPDEDCVPVHLGNLEPWSLVLGRGALWVWDLRNHQGYADGLQYSFANTVSDGEIIVQLMVIGSQISVYSVAESHNKWLQPTP